MKVRVVVVCFKNTSTLKYMHIIKKLLKQCAFLVRKSKMALAKSVERFTVNDQELI